MELDSGAYASPDHGRLEDAAGQVLEYEFGAPEGSQHI
jgi:hypothetical protein